METPVQAPEICIHTKKEKNNQPIKHPEDLGSGQRIENTVQAGYLKLFLKNTNGIKAKGSY